MSPAIVTATAGRFALAGVVLAVIVVHGALPCAAQPGQIPAQTEALPPALPVPPAPPAPLAPGERLRLAVHALDSGNYRETVELLVPLLLGRPGEGSAFEALDRRDRAEAFRVHGLALFFLDRRDAAEAAFLRYLELDVDARLDPALVPPEAIVFFEDVRSRHAAELRKFRPKPKPRRYWALNLIPVAGQMQNHHYRKGWFIAGLGTVLAATHITTYFVLDSWCDPATRVCRSGDEARTDAARSLRVFNIASGTLLIGLAIYSVADGFLNYKQTDTQETTALDLAPLGSHGAQVVLRGRF